MAEQIESAVYLGVLAFSVSDDGVLAYGVGTGRASFQMVWVDRQGKVIGTVAPEANYRGLDLAPDGNRVVTHRHEGQGGDIWVTELSRGTTSQFRFDASLDNSSPICVSGRNPDRVGLIPCRREGGGLTSEVCERHQRRGTASSPSRQRALRQ